MQEHRRLQYPGNDIAPVDDPVEVVELAGVLEGVRDERNYAENVEVRRTCRRPASQQYVQPDSQINQRDEAQVVVERAVRRNQQYLGIQSVTDCRDSEYIALTKLPLR